MNATIFFDEIRRRLFDGRLSESQVVGINGVLTAWDQLGDGDLENLAYVLASVYHETGRRMVPVREGFAQSDGAARRLVAGSRYGKPVPPHGHVYYGRGQLQLTWADNYSACSAIAGVDLFRDPDLALDPVIGARIAVAGILDGRFNARGQGVEHYLGGPGPEDDDLKGARRTVNVTDRWQMIGGYYKAFRAALTAAGLAAEASDGPEAPEWLEAAQRLAEWRARSPEGHEQTLKWLMEMPA